ncbi:MAG: fimbrillin family protein [Bacteroidaceae bacterium]|nr:fimbrillin family protein [Bacteroidaceae bacterium]
MKHIKLMALLLAVGLTACSSDDEVERGLLPEDSSNLKQRPLFSDDSQAQRLIIVEVEETPMTDTSAPEEEKMETRATATTTSTLAAFSMNCQGNKDNKYDFTKTGTEWSSFYWPGSVENDERIDFYAYTGGTFNYNSDNPYLTFTVAEDASNQHDLLVAEHKQIAYNDAGGRVSLSFNHACAAIQFKIGQSQTLANKSVTFKSITLVGVYNSGKYYYNQTPAWQVQEQSGDAYYTLEDATSIEVPFSTKTHDGARWLDCGCLFMIPQAHSNAIIRIGYNTNKTADISLGPINWEAGKLYTISIRLGTNTIVTE